jgi:hypothetical protein
MNIREQISRSKSLMGITESRALNIFRRRFDMSSEEANNYFREIVDEGYELFSSPCEHESGMEYTKLFLQNCAYTFVLRTVYQHEFSDIIHELVDVVYEMYAPDFFDDVYRHYLYVRKEEGC